MAIVNPFKALRPQPQFAPKVASRPYDVLNSLEAKIEARGNPHSFLHITKAEIDLPEKTDVHSKDVYDQAKQNLTAFIQRGVLFREDKSCFYIYQLIMNGRSQTGLVGVSSIEDYENDVIKKHEFTRPEKEQDRINHIKTTGAQTGNVFLAYRNVAEIDEVINKWKSTHDPVYDFIADDGVSHAIWVINSNEVNDKIKKLFDEKVPATYIADGHHRAASAAKVRLQVEENYFLTTLFPANELKIMDYNRVVKDLNGLEPDALVEKLMKNFDVTEEKEAVAPAKLHEFGMYLKNKWYRLTAKQNTYTDDPIGVLDVTILSDNVLDEILGIKDQRTDKRIDFIGGIRGLSELENRVKSGEMAVAFSLYPVSIEQLFDIADSGQVMPPKSTWFEPKLRDGLLTHVTGEQN
ncbi:MAG: DUF1015 domain-containing protein [Chitinophagaceae bacterium]|nr:MAG: DUF1015 domain-containing protein [Chitinophagaceae bacterium]